MLGETGRKRSFGYELTMKIIGSENVGIVYNTYIIYSETAHVFCSEAPHHLARQKKPMTVRNDRSGFRLITKLPNRNRLIPGVPPLVTAVWLSRGLV